jgi:hypothetical protein
MIIFFSVLHSSFEFDQMEKSVVKCCHGQAFGGLSIVFKFVIEDSVQWQLRIVAIPRYTLAVSFLARPWKVEENILSQETESVGSTSPLASANRFVDKLIFISLSLLDSYSSAGSFPSTQWVTPNPRVRGYACDIRGRGWI